MLHLTWRAWRFISGNTLKLETPTGAVWHRYNYDSHGDHEDGASLDGAGIGRGRPLLTGKRMCRTEHREFRCSLRDERVIHLPLQAVQRYLIEKTVSRRGMWIHIADLTTKALPEGKQVTFTFYWPDINRWDGANFIVRIGSLQRDRTASTYRSRSMQSKSETDGKLLVYLAASVSALGDMLFGYGFTWCRKPKGRPLSRLRRTCESGKRPRAL